MLSCVHLNKSNWRRNNVKKFLYPLLGLFILVSVPVNAEEESEAEEVEAVSENEKEPSDDAKKVAKEATEATHAFDPHAYTCTRFLEDFAKDEVTDEFGIAIVWGHGYFSASYGSDAMGPLTAETSAEVIQYFMDYCEENKSVSLSRAAYMIAEDE
jgi:hypothetical protein